MKKHILLALMMMCATCAMAVKFPASGVGGGSTGEGYQPESGIGPSYNNSVVLGNSGANCAQQNPGTWTSDQNGCVDCCNNSVTYPCMDEIMAIIAAGGTPDKTGADCEKLGFECTQVCEEYLGYSPLDSSVYFLLALIAAYGAFAVYRKKMQEV